VTSNPAPTPAACSGGATAGPSPSAGGAGSRTPGFGPAKLNGSAALLRGAAAPARPPSCSDAKLESRGEPPDAPTASMRAGALPPAATAATVRATAASQGPAAVGIVGGAVGGPTGAASLPMAGMLGAVATSAAALATRSGGAGPPVAVDPESSEGDGLVTYKLKSPYGRRGAE